MQMVVKTWSGVLIQAVGLGAPARSSEAEQKRGRHFRNNISVLPPLKSLPPPVSLSDPVSSNIDLRVNFESEIMPYLGRCLVSPWLANSPLFLGSKSNFGGKLPIMRVGLIKCLWKRSWWKVWMQHRTSEGSLDKVLLCWAMVSLQIEHLQKKLADSVHGLWTSESPLQKSFLQTRLSRHN